MVTMAGAGALASGIAGIAGALGGGSKYKSWHGRENARNEWFNVSGDLESKNYYDAVRRGAEKAGFSPLTALGNAPGVGSAAGTVTAPKLASIGMLIDGIRGVADEFTGAGAQRREMERLELDLAKTKIDALRLRPGALDAIGASTMPRLGSGHTRPAHSSTISTGDSWLTPGRAVEVDPRINSGGIMTIENAVTGGPVHVWGDEVASDISEMAFQGIQALPQIGFNWLRKGYNTLKSNGTIAPYTPASNVPESNAGSFPGAW